MGVRPLVREYHFDAEPEHWRDVVACMSPDERSHVAYVESENAFSGKRPLVEGITTDAKIEVPTNMASEVMTELQINTSADKLKELLRTADTTVVALLMDNPVSHEQLMDLDRLIRTLEIKQ